MKHLLCYRLKKPAMKTVECELYQKGENDYIFTPSPCNLVC